MAEFYIDYPLISIRVDFNMAFTLTQRLLLYVNVKFNRTVRCVWSREREHILKSNGVSVIFTGLLEDQTGKVQMSQSHFLRNE